MVEKTRYAPGTPSWVDVTCPDIDAGIQFYRELFGWEIEKGGEDFGYYSMAHLGGRTVAGLTPAQPDNPAPPMWNTYLASDDADATAKAAANAGATVAMEPMDVGTQGRMFFAFDPTGAPFGVWQAGEHTGAQVVNEPGTWGWNELHTPDRQAANDFYAAVFGYEYEQLGDGKDFDYTVMKTNGAAVGGQCRDGNAPPHWKVYFEVVDADATAEQARSLGGSVESDPRDTPYGRIAELVDPWGATFSVIVSSAPESQ